jgi:hypothetical protein
LSLGAVITEKNDFGQNYVVAYASQSNNTAEVNYSSYKKETLAAVWAIAHFHSYLYGQCFTLVTHYQALRWLLASDKLIDKLTRWVLLT